MTDRRKPDDPRKPQDLRESDIADEVMGSNRLQGDDQARVRNQRHAVPHMKHKTDGIVEGLEKAQDRERRAREDLGKRPGKASGPKGG